MAISKREARYPDCASIWNYAGILKRSNPKKYIDAAMAIVSSPKNALRGVLRNDLVFQLKLRSAAELAQQYVSNITAEILLSHGVTETVFSVLIAHYQSHSKLNVDFQALVDTPKSTTLSG